jgi:hypothetical protein
VTQNPQVVVKVQMEVVVKVQMEVVIKVPKRELGYRPFSFF